MKTDTYSYALLAGGGALPPLVLERLLDMGHTVLVFSFTGQPQPNLPKTLPEGVKHIVHPIAAVGKTLKLLKQYGVENVILAGHLSKPKLLDLKPDAAGLTLMAKLTRHGDNDFLQLVQNVLEKEGYSVQSVQEICPEICPDKAFIQDLSSKKLTTTEEADVALGAEVLRHMAHLDVGQACVVQNKTILGVEGVEGTDALILRCKELADLKAKTKPVLVKLPKTGQTEQADLPTIGSQTLQNLEKGGYAGVALQAGKTLVMQQEEVAKYAKQAKLFIKAVDDA